MLTTIARRFLMGSSAGAAGTGVGADTGPVCSCTNEVEQYTQRACFAETIRSHFGHLRTTDKGDLHLGHSCVPSG